MYNGIGLRTARGSGTNGFVQRNLSYIRPSRVLEITKTHEQEIIEPKMKSQDKLIIEHQVKREIEMALLELEDKMEEQGFSKEEIKKRVDSERTIRMGQLNDKVVKLIKEKKEEEEGKTEELHDYLGEEGKKVWMEEDRKASSHNHRRHDRSRSRSRSHSHSRRDRSHSHSHRHHSHHRHH